MTLKPLQFGKFHLSLMHVHRAKLGAGAVADVVIYQPDADYEQMFSQPEWVLRRGQVIVRAGRVVAAQAPKVTHTVKPDYDSAIERRLRDYYDNYQTVRFANFSIGDEEMAQHIGSPVVTHACAR